MASDFTTEILKCTDCGFESNYAVYQHQNHPNEEPTPYRCGCCHTRRRKQAQDAKKRLTSAQYERDLQSDDPERVAAAANYFRSQKRADKQTAKNLAKKAELKCCDCGEPDPTVLQISKTLEPGKEICICINCSLKRTKGPRFWHKGRSHLGGGNAR